MISPIQLRQLIAACISPNPEGRPSIEQVYAVAQEMHTKLSRVATPQ